MDEQSYPEGAGQAPGTPHYGPTTPPTMPVPHAETQRIPNAGPVASNAGPQPVSSASAAPVWGTPGPTYPGNGSAGPGIPGPGTPGPGAPGPGRPAKRSWWSLPKVLVAAGLAVLLAGGGGAAIGYSMGKSDAAHQAAQRFQNGRQGGFNGQGRRGGQGQPTAPGSQNGSQDGGQGGGSPSGGTNP